MKIDRANLERLTGEWPGMRGIADFMYQLLYTNPRGESAYLISENGGNPFHNISKEKRIITGSVLREQYTYGALPGGMFWFPIYRRT
jgi:hypothetical protein